jgi:TatA/E family protein of Tat protein translocase
MVVANIMGPDFVWVIIIAVLVIFGGSQLPKIARNVGAAGKEFRKAQQEAEAEDGARAAGAPPASEVAPATPLAVPAVTSSPVVPPVPSSPVPAPTAPAPSAAGPPEPVGAPGPVADERVNLTRAELDALLADRERRVRSETEGPTT